MIPTLEFWCETSVIALGVAKKEKMENVKMHPDYTNSTISSKAQHFEWYLS